MAVKNFLGQNYVRCPSIRQSSSLVGLTVLKEHFEIGRTGILKKENNTVRFALRAEIGPKVDEAQIECIDLIKE